MMLRKVLFAIWLLVTPQLVVAQQSCQVVPTGSLPSAFFSMTANTRGGSHAPSVTVGGFRLWDTTAVWPLLNTAAGTYNWSELDAWVTQIAGAGADTMFTLGRTPCWIATSCVGTYNPNGSSAPPSDVNSDGTGTDATLKAFATALATHSLTYGANKIKYYEFWNEPDLNGTWSGTAAQLVRMGKDYYQQIKAVDPAAIIIGPAPSTGNSSGIHFLPAYYAAGGAPWQDIVGMHAYVYNGSNFATVPEGITVIISKLKALMNANGIGNKVIWFTEGSWGGSPNNSGMSSVQKQMYLSRDFILMWANEVGRFYWYAWDNHSDNLSIGFGTLCEGTFGSCTPNNTSVTYTQVRSWLVGSTHSPNPCSLNSSNGVYSCVLTLTGNVSAQILWTTGSNVNIPVSSIFGHYKTAANASVTPISGNSVPVSGMPLMVIP